MGRLCAVYGILCKETNRWYVGASIDTKRRIRDHFYGLRTWGRFGKAGEMGNDFVKYGRGAFEAVILECVNDPSRLVERELYWAEMKGATLDGYNAQAPGNNRHWEDQNG